MSLQSRSEMSDHISHLPQSSTAFFDNEDNRQY